MTGIIEILKGLRQCPREFWVMIVLKVLFAYSYFSIAPVLTLYLTNEHGFTDAGAANMYSGWAIFMSLYQFAAGPVIDWLGIRRSLIFGALMATIGGFILALAFNSPVAVGIALFFFVPLGSAYLLTPVDIGGKRYSKNVDGALNVVFSVFYSGANLGALLAGITIESIRDQFGVHGIDVSTRHATVERLTIMSGAIVTAIGGLIAALLVADAPLQTQQDLEASNVTLTGTVPAVPDNAEPAVGPVIRRRFEAVFKAFKWLKTDVVPVLLNHFFQSLLLFTFTLVGVRTVFRYIDTVFPKVVLRAIGPEAHYGALYSINPLILVFITPFVGTFATRYDIYNVILVGTTVAAASVFIMRITVTTATVVLWSIVFTIGEAIYSPQTNIYVMAVAPEGREGIYASLVNAPNLLAKIINGPLSGYELETYCPRDGPYTGCNRVWQDIGLLALSTPLLLLVFKRFIHTEQIAVRINSRMSDRSMVTD